MSAAERVLGVSRRDLGRAERFASIYPDAQAIIREARLDDIQVALEEIAGELAEQQVDKALELKERYRRPRRNRARNGDAKPDATPKQGQLPETESPDLAPDDGDSDEETEKAVEVPDTRSAEPSGEVDQPSALDHRASDDEKFDILKSLWEQYMADDWEDASERVHQWFVKRVLGYAVVVTDKGDRSHH
jgi:hypothetical protein